MAHLQLLSAHWIPLIWLLIARIARGEAGGWAAAGLATVLGLQLFSSYYLAYFTTLSIAVLLAAIVVRDGLRLRPALRLLAAAAIPYAALAVFSIPYLQREGALELLPRVPLPDSATLSEAWQSLAPQLAVSFGSIAPDQGYTIPAVTFALAISALALWAVRRGPGNGRVERARSLALALGCIVVVAFVMSLGRRIWLGGEMWMLPAGWASAWIPGFDKLRGPLRWQILIGVAVAPLAGVGVWVLERWLRNLGSGGTGLLVGALRGALLLSIFVSLPWRALPVTAAIEAHAQRSSGYRALGGLEPGPVLEIPWSMDQGRNVVEDSRYVLASTLHWKPILNGFTGYRPPSYALLQRIAQTLPEAHAIERMQRLTGLRWIVVHLDRMKPAQRRAWQNAGPVLKRVYSGPVTWIFEVRPGAANAGVWTEGLRSRDARERTLSGLSRSPLPLEAVAGEIRMALPPEFPSFLRHRRWVPVPFVIENRGQQPWPGLDVQREGLVELRYRFLRGDTVVFEGAAPLDDDVAPGARIDGLAHLRADVPAGEYRLAVDLVQRRGDRVEPLPVPGLARTVRVID